LPNINKIHLVEAEEMEKNRNLSEYFAPSLGMKRCSLVVWYTVHFIKCSRKSKIRDEIDEKINFLSFYSINKAQILYISVFLRRQCTCEIFSEKIYFHTPKMGKRVDI
jgi:hypothetical protein